ncbi:MAG: PIG-L family deacetylase [Acidobacteria bacterium]|nr:PIG-L family deacetylase [Acidobacteriota bacterium]
MMRLKLSGGTDGPLNILCLGCHSDDIEIGCGGTILRLAEENPGCVFHWVVFSAPGVRESEARCAAELFTTHARLESPHLKAFPDGFLPYIGAEVKMFFEELKQKISPDLIFTHNGRDAHQDHRLISELTWNTFRNHMILEYEIPKYDGDMGQPTFFIPLSAEVAQRKVGYIIKTFRSQASKAWFEERTFLSIMRIRGMECNAPSGYSEAFFCRKIIL